MKNIHIQYYKTKIGELILGTYQENVCLLDFRYRKMRSTVDNRIKRGLNSEFHEQNNDLLKETKKQIDEYLGGVRTRFELPIILTGTDFQKEVWSELIKIPYGKTSTYLDIANSINNPKAVRAVANANGANAIALIVPCHRIIGTNGELIVYGGGIPIKKRLLKLESETSHNIFEERFSLIENREKKYDGTFFTAVKTTGVFCKPSCSAKKPNKENVVFYDTKEEAVEKGYRPCKVCKP